MSDTPKPTCGNPGCMSDLVGSRACLSPGRNHRFALWRVWAQGPLLGFIMLNPSVANEIENDPTIRRCIAFARRDGYAGIIVCNLRSDIATNPDGIPACSPVADRENVMHTRRRFGLCGIVIAAWGVNATRIGAKLDVSCEHFALHRLGELTKNGSPRHPLYLKSTTPIVEWRAALNPVQYE